MIDRKAEIAEALQRWPHRGVSPSDAEWLLSRLGELEADNEQLRREIAAQRSDPLRHIKAKHDPDFVMPCTDEEWRALDA